MVKLVFMAVMLTALYITLSKVGSEAAAVALTIAAGVVATVILGLLHEA